jgi:hypothetical protein
MVNSASNAVSRLKIFDVFRVGDGLRFDQFQGVIVSVLAF